jgi:PAS domain-containing protein
MKNPQDHYSSLLEQKINSLQLRVSELDGINSALRRSIEALLDREARTAIALTTARTGIWEYDLGSGHISIDPGLMLLLGLRNGEDSCSLEDFDSYLVPGERESLKRELDHLLAGDIEHARMEFQIRNSRCGNMLLAVDGSLVLDGEGQPSRLIGICTDLTRVRGLDLESEESGT